MSRSPYGERGLKSVEEFERLHPAMSLSLRRAWIEIACRQETARPRRRRSPYGERGLKSLAEFGRMDVTCRSPYGERGLKYYR